jgi:virulence factor Mce-like protein
VSRRRVVAVLAVALVAGVAGILALRPSAAAEQDVAVDVVFDDSRGLLPGQLVMIAGARVGEIADVSLTEDFKARVHLRIDPRFAPFRRDAQCTIKPQGLIAENYVDCTPGTPDAPPLRARGERAPTVPVEQTTQPVSLTDLFEVWNTPTRERVGMLLSTLGIANAGRGEDVNAILRRANPALTLARRTIAQLRAQRDDLARIIDASGPVAAALAERPAELRRLLRHTSRATAEVASERAALGEGVRRLPGLLREARPALASLDAVMASGRPLLDQLESAAPDVNRLSADLPRLAAAARPTLRALGPVLRRGAKTSRRTAPLSRAVQRYAADSLPSARTAGELVPGLEERGVDRNLLAFLYNTALATARYDDNGHLLPSHVGLTECMRYATTPSPACGALTPAPAAQAATRRRSRPARASRPAAPVTPATAVAPAQRAPEAPAAALPSTRAPAPTEPAVEGLLDFLLG